jgi:hypothetical protein
VSLAGFIVALLVYGRTDTTLLRAPYFAYSFLILVAVTIVSFAWYYSYEAITNGTLWLIYAINYLTGAFSGYLYGLLALARSRDAFGTGRYAILAYVPVLNLILHVKPSRNAESPSAIPVPVFLRGGFGVAVGCVLVVVGGVLTGMERILMEAKNSDAGEEKLIGLLFQSQGVVKALPIVAAQSQKVLPMRINATTRFVSIAAKDDRLQRTYEISRDGFAFNDRFIALIENSICENSYMTLFLREGVTIEEIYERTDGTLLGRQTVSQDTCRHP